MNTRRVIRSLSYLHRILEAGERGYAVSASNVNNQGLKILLRAYAQQRARFKSEITDEIIRLGGTLRQRSSIRGVLHRGRIDIFAALTIGNEEREAVVLKEIMVGETTAMYTYKSVIKRAMPDETRSLVEKQYEEVRHVVEQIQLLRGAHGMRMVVQLFDEEKHVDAALRELKNAGISPASIKVMKIQDAIELYSGKTTTKFETSISGATGGAMWGGVIGAIAGVGAQQSVLSPVPYLGIDIWMIFAILGILAGGFIGFVLGYFIGMGISEDDNYLQRQDMNHEAIILMAFVNTKNISEARQIMAQLRMNMKRLVPEISP